MALESGDRVKVMNTTYGGEIIVEGIATIIKPTGIRNQFTVRFDGDPKKETHDRFCFEENKVEEG